MPGKHGSKSLIVSGPLDDLGAFQAPNLRGGLSLPRARIVAHSPKTGQQDRPAKIAKRQEIAPTLRQGIRAFLDALPEYPGSASTATWTMGVMRKHLSVARLTYQISE